jgi:catalase
MAARHDASDDDNYSQPRVFYQVKKTCKKKKFFSFLIYHFLESIR